jgi:SulP family sulfate permease
LPEDAALLRDLPKDVVIYEINGPLLFGAAERFKDTFARVARKPRVLIIRMRHVPTLDSTALHVLRDVVRRSRGDGTEVLLTEVQPAPLAVLLGSAALQDIGRENIHDDMADALSRARQAAPS